MRTMRATSLLLLVFLGMASGPAGLCACGRAATAKLAERPTLQKAGKVSQSQPPVVVADEGIPVCNHQPAGTSQIFRGPVYLSPDGRHRAYAENESHARGSGEGCEDCTNNSRLFVADTPDAVFRLVLLQSPSRYELGNWIKIIDWSPDSRFLLFEEGGFQYCSDAGGSAPRCYEAESGIFSEENGPGSVPYAFSQMLNKDCEVAVQALGFSPDGGLVLKAFPWFELGDEEPSNDSCLKKEGLWLLEAKAGKLSPLPNDYKVVRYSTAEKGVTK